MTHDTRSSDDIERDIIDQRAQMSDTMNDLQQKFSVDAIVSDLGDMIRSQGGDLGRSIRDTVGRNPAAAVLVGVGLAWLFLGQNSGPATKAAGRQSGQASGGRNRLVSQPWESEAVRDLSDDGQGRYGEGQLSNDYRQDRGAKGWAGKHTGPDDAAHGMLGTIRTAATKVGDAVSDAAGSMGHTASDLTERLSHGLEDLSEEAKSRVLAARRAAHEARQSSQAALNRGSRAASGFFEDQPLVVGALAVAVGAAIAGLLPHSRIEDDIMGDSSDQLFADAQAIFREELDRAGLSGSSRPRSAG